MSSDIEKFPPPNDATAFESLCLDLWQDIWSYSAQKNGRDGQPQAGVDIYGQDEAGDWIGIQCKQRDYLLWSKVTVGELDKEVAAATQFVPPLVRFILATTGPRDSKLQQRARILTDQRNKEKLFAVEVWSWDDIWHELYGRKELFRKIAESYWPRRTLEAVTEAYVSRLPATDSTLLGRDTELTQLELAWENQANLFQIIASGGTGKTALMTKWYKRHVGAVPIFGWSFYRQGASENSQVSSDEFLQAAIDRFNLRPKAITADAKVQALIHHMRQHKALLILDGLEPLQNNENGDLYDYPIKDLLRELATQNAGFVLCTTRVRLSDVVDDERALSLELDNLSEADGVRYLREKFGIHGSDDELVGACQAYGNHALALTLLGTYLKHHGGDITRRFEIDELPATDTKPGRQARQVMQSYAKLFAGKAEGAILRGLGFFDRPAERDALRLVLSGLLDENALTALKDARLILTADAQAPIDCHPLVREYFGVLTKGNDPEGFRAGHSRLFDHYCALPKKQLPETLEELTPLFAAVSHGCLAGRYDDVLLPIYRDRISHGDGVFYLWKQLGAFGINLSLLAYFFDLPWTLPAAAVATGDQSWVLNSAAFCLRALGRLADAVEPTRKGAEAEVHEENWTNAARAYSNFSELLMTLGRLPEAVLAARKGVAFANHSQDLLHRSGRLATLADILHQSSQPTDLTYVASLFVEAELLQMEREPEYPLLYGLQGYRYCDLLLAQAKGDEAVCRATQTLVWAQDRLGPLAIGLDHLTLGRALPPGSPESGNHLDEAITNLRRAGQLDYLLRALLARATDADLAEVHRLATRSGMRFYLTDYHLAMVRRDPNKSKALEHLEKAKKLVQDTGYHRREAEVSKLYQYVDHTATDESR